MDSTVIFLTPDNLDIGIMYEYLNNATYPEVLLNVDHYVDISIKLLDADYDKITGAFVPTFYRKDLELCTSKRFGNMTEATKA